MKVTTLVLSVISQLDLLGFQILVSWSDVTPVIWCRSKWSKLCVHVHVCRCPRKWYFGAEFCCLISVVWCSPPTAREGGLCSCSSLHWVFVSPGLAKLDSLLCMEGRYSSTFGGKSSRMDAPEELSHQFPPPLTALVRPFNFWTILCLCFIYLDDLFWGIFSQTKDEPGAVNWFVSLLRQALVKQCSRKGLVLRISDKW